MDPPPISPQVAPPLQELSIIWSLLPSGYVNLSSDALKMLNGATCLVVEQVSLSFFGTLFYTVATSLCICNIIIYPFLFYVIKCLKDKEKFPEIFS